MNRKAKKAIGPSTYPNLLKVKGRAMIPAPTVLLTMMVVVKKKSMIIHAFTSFSVIGVTGKDTAFLILIPTQLSRMQITVFLPDCSCSAVGHIII